MGVPIPPSTPPSTSLPRPSLTPAPPPAGSSVTRAIAQLDGLAERPLAEHPDVYQQVHEALQGALADIDDA